MTTVERPDVNADVERRLRSWMTADARDGDLTTLYDGIVESTRNAPQRRRLLVPARNRRSTVAGTRAVSGRRLVLAAAVVGAVLLAVAAVLVGARLLRNHGPLPGIFRGAADIPLLAGSLTRPSVAVLQDGRILFAGTGDAMLAGVVFDPATDSFGPAVHDAAIRRAATATTLQSGLVLLTGGEFGQTDAASFTTVLFDPTSGTFAETSPLNVARSDHTATLLDDGRVLIAGGRHYPGTGSPRVNDHVVALDSTEIYDPATGKFSLTSPMHLARAGHTATKLPDGRVLIVGGYSNSPTGAHTMAALAEIFDPATGSFRLVRSMPTPRGHHTATLLDDGRVLLVGGADDYGPRGEKLVYTTSAELFDQSSETFAATESLVTERAGHSATLLADGRVLVLGGSNERGSPHSTEVFDPDTGRFQPGPPTQSHHDATVAPRLADGRILVAGSGPGGSEMFDPEIPASTAVMGSTSNPAFSAIAGPGMPTINRSIRLKDGRILLVGGAPLPDGDFAPAVEVFDPATGRIDAVGSVPDSGIPYPMTVLPDGRVLFIASARESPVATYFDPRSMTFAAAPAVTRAIQDHRILGASDPDDGALILVQDDGRMVAVDGTTGQTTPPMGTCGDEPLELVPLADGRVLVPCANVDTVILDVRSARSESTDLRIDHGVQLGDGRIVAMLTTYDSTGYEGHTVTGIYDPATRTVMPVSIKLPLGTMVAGDGAHLLVFGGSYGASSSAAVEIDLISGASRDVGPMIAQRSDATALALSDGRILVAGGSHISADRTDPIPPEAELFDPSRIP